MNKMYCFSCGGAISYGSAKPSFCSHCGTPLTKETKHQSVSGASISEQYRAEEDDDESTGWSASDFSQESLEVELNTSNVETFGEMGQVNYDQVGGLEPLQKREAPDISNKESLAQFKREAGFKEKGKPSKKQTRKRKPK